MSTERETIQKLQNEAIDLKNHIKKEHKIKVQLLAEVDRLEKGIIALARSQKDALKNFEEKHGSCINSILKIVENPNFATLPGPDRKKAILGEYQKIILGGVQKEKSSIILMN